MLKRLRRSGLTGAPRGSAVESVGDAPREARPGIAPLLEPVEGAPACANCGASVVGPFCANCGQETRLALPTARAFLREAAGRYIALDGRTWRTLGALFFRPGLLTREYLLGRRRRYVRPGRLFLVLSLVLFAAFRLLGDLPSVITLDKPKDAANGVAAKKGTKAEPRDGGKGVRVDEDFNVTLDELDGPLLLPLRQRLEAFNHLTQQQKSEQIFNGTLRYGPYALVALLPVFAALMKLAYLGRARRYPQRPRRYAAHLVFGAHNHAFLFLAVLAFAAIPFVPVRAAIVFWAAIYLLRSMKLVYGGRWSGVVLRATLVTFIYSIIFALAMAALVVVAIAVR